MTGPARLAEQTPPPPPPESPWESLPLLSEELAEGEGDSHSAVNESLTVGGLLFGAQAPEPFGVPFNPEPTVKLNGVDLFPGLFHTGLVAVDGVSVTWGREGVLDQPDPATGTLQLFDPSGRWATAEDRRGQAVEIRWGGSYATGSLRYEGTYFRGRIGSPIRASRKTVTYPGGRKVTGSLVTIPLEGVLLDLANRVPTVAWPAETMGARRARVEADILATGQTATPTGYTPPAPVSQVITRAYWQTPNVKPVAAADQVSLLDHVVALYDSSGADRMTYFPETRQTANLHRKERATTTRGIAGLVRKATATAHTTRNGQGVYVSSYAFTNTTTGVTSPALFLDSGTLEYEPADGITQPGRITRVQVVHPDEAAGYASRTSEQRVTGTDEAQSGVRTARLESLVAWNAWADVARGDVESMVRREGSQWVLQPVHLSTRRVGGFETLEQAQVLLAGAETDAVIFLQRSWLPELGIRPMYGVQGGTIAYRQGGWDLDLVLTPVTTPGLQHAISWEEIDDGTTGNEVQWWDDDHPNGMHESLTLEDLGYCATGLNVSAIGPNTGWDEYQ